MSALYFYCIALVCGTVLAAGLAKLNSLTQFAGALTSTLGLRGAWASWGARLLVLLELLTPLAVLAGVPTRRAALLVLLALHLAFAVVLAAAALRRVPVACNCFGAKRNSLVVGIDDIWRNVVLSGAILCALTAPGQPPANTTGTTIGLVAALLSVAVLVQPAFPNVTSTIPTHSRPGRIP